MANSTRSSRNRGGRSSFLDQSNSRNSTSAVDASSSVSRDSAYRSLRLILPLIALYTLFTLAWTTPIASVLHSTGTSVKRRMLKSQNDPVVDTTVKDSSVLVTADESSPVVDANTEASSVASSSGKTIDVSSSNSNVSKDSVSSRASDSTSSSSSSTNSNSILTEDDNPASVEKQVVDPNSSPSTKQSTSIKQDASDGTDSDSLRPATRRREVFNLPQPACMQGGARARTFLMVFMGHSGSTAILSELKNHEDMFVDEYEPVDHGDIQQNTSEALQYTRDFFDRGIKAGKVPGFKIRPLHIRNDPQAWVDLTREYDTRIIWQYRQNTLKQAVGEYSYRVLNDDSILEGLKSEEEVANRCDIGAGCKFAINDMDAFHGLLKNVVQSDYAIAEGVQLISGGRDCVHELRYEDYLYHRQGTMLDLLEFLGVKQIKTEPMRYKATRDNMCDVIKNWDDVCRAFYGCKIWRNLFEDDRNGCSCRFSSSPSQYCSGTFD